MKDIKDSIAIKLEHTLREIADNNGLSRHQATALINNVWETVDTTLNDLEVSQ